MLLFRSPSDIVSASCSAHCSALEALAGKLRGCGTLLRDVHASVEEHIAMLRKQIDTEHRQRRRQVAAVNDLLMQNHFC